MSKISTLFIILSISSSVFAFEANQIELVDEVQWFLWHEGVESQMPHFDAVTSQLLDMNENSKGMEGSAVSPDFIATEELIVGLEG